MDEPVEEFEPLFDYSRVQPFNVVFIDDDDSLDSAPVDCRKKAKTIISDVDKNGKNGKGVEIIDDDKEEKIDKEDEDWLPPPQKITADSTKFNEDSSIRKFRLKGQELASLAQQPQDLLREVEESVKRELAAESNKRDLSALLESAAAEGCKEQQPKLSSDRAKIVICIQNKNETKPFRFYMDDKFEKLFKLYADKFDLDLQKLFFSFDGENISPTATPGSLEMEDNDIIEVHVKK